MSLELDSLRARLESEQSMMIWRETLRVLGPDVARRLRTLPNRFNTFDDMVHAAVWTTKEIVDLLAKWDMPLNQMDPGHALGHIARDHISALLIALYSPQLSLNERFVAIIAGSLHDIGCALFSRYADGQGVVRHADAGGLLLERALFHVGASADKSAMEPFSFQEEVSIVSAVVAHTHYLKPMQMKDRSGQEYTIAPFEDVVDDVPVWSMWLTRWADRLDANGPTFVARHFLTLGEGHKDFASDVGFYETEFASHLEPLLRTPDEIKRAGTRTMLEHLDMFRASQTNETPYGRFDNAGMCVLRDARTAQLEKIIAAVRDARPHHSEDTILEAWIAFLSDTIEPQPLIGRPCAQKLVTAFRHLPQDTRQAWLAGFEQTMMLYRDEWYPDLLRHLDALKIAAPSLNLYTLVFFGKPIVKFLAPSSSWTNLL